MPLVLKRQDIGARRQTPVLRHPISGGMYTKEQQREYDRQRRARPEEKARSRARVHRVREWAEQNPEKYAAYRERYNATPERKRKAAERTKRWAAANPERAKALQKRKRANRARAEELNRYKREWWSDPQRLETNRLNGRAHAARRRDLTRHSLLPVIFRKEIKAIYANCPPGHEVDHIHPLRIVNAAGEHIGTGLFVPWNLQYLPMRENRQKRNKLLEVA